MGTTESNANKIKYGLKNVYYAPITALSEEGFPTYGTPVKWPGAVNLTLDAEGDTNTFYADNVAYYVSNANNGYSGDFESALIPESFRTDILGESEDAKKVLVEDANAPTKYFALLFQFEGDKKAVRHIMYKCTCSRPTLGSQTTESGIEPQTETAKLTATAIYDTTTKKNIVKARTSENTDATTYDSWFTKVYLPTATA